MERRERKPVKERTLKVSRPTTQWSTRSNYGRAGTLAANAPGDCRCKRSYSLHSLLRRGLFFVCERQFRGDSRNSRGTAIRKFPVPTAFGRSRPEAVVRQSTVYPH